MLPYAPRMGAMLVDHVALDGEPAPVCQRSFLKRMEARLAERGATLEVGVRERVLARHGRRRRATCRSTPGSASRRSARRRRRSTWTSSSTRSTRRGSCSSSTTRSSATGSTRSRPAHAPALRAADEQLLVRETIRGVAARHGLVASLAPKPWPDNAGNGCHIHFSLWDGRRLAEPLPRLRRAGRALGGGALVRRGRARAPARPLRPDGAELQLVPPDRPAVLGGRVRLLGPRQPRGAGARAVGVRRDGGGVDERRAEVGGRELRTRTSRSAG